MQNQSAEKILSNIARGFVRVHRCYDSLKSAGIKFSASLADFAKCPKL